MFAVCAASTYLHTSFKDSHVWTLFFSLYLKYLFSSVIFSFTLHLSPLPFTLSFGLFCQPVFPHSFPSFLPFLILITFFLSFFLSLFTSFHLFLFLFRLLYLSFDFHPFFVVFFLAFSSSFLSTLDHSFYVPLFILLSLLSSHLQP